MNNVNHQERESDKYTAPTLRPPLYSLTPVIYLYYRMQICAYHSEWSSPNSKVSQENIVMIWNLSEA